MGPLTFAHAAGLALLAGAVPIVLLYVLRAKPVKVRVASVWLWSAARRDLQARTPWQRLRRQLPLLFELLALVGCALGFAGASCRGRTLGGDHVAIVIDVSASMSARDEASGRTRIELARDAALRVVDGLAPGAQAMLVAAGRDARVLVPLGPVGRALREATRALAVTDTEGEPAGAVALAVDRMRSLSGARRVLFVTDGASAPDAPPLRSGQIAVQQLRVGSAVDNTGIVRFDVRAAPTGARARAPAPSGARRDDAADTRVQAFALLAHHGVRPRDAFVTLRLDGDRAILASRRLRLEPGRREPVVLEFAFRSEDAGRGLVLEVEPPDVMPVDDTAYSRVPPAPQLPVLLAAAAPSPWVRRALETDADATVTRVEDPQHAAAEAPPGALLVYEGACPPEAPLGHDVLVFNPPQGRCVGMQVGATVEAPSITSFVGTDARLRFLSLDDVHVLRANPIDPGPRGSALVSADAHTLLADASEPDRSITVVGFDVQDSDWPLKASFVLFVRNVEELARAHRNRPVLGGGRAGEPLRVAVPPDVRRVAVEGPLGRSSATATAGTAVLGETARVGLYRVRWAGGEAVAPVNLLSDAESNLRAPPRTVEGGETLTDARALVRPHEDLTPWAALIAALALAADLYFTTRRARRVDHGVLAKFASARRERGAP